LSEVCADKPTNFLRDEADWWILLDELNKLKIEGLHGCLPGE
jgi:hypothetical protein